MKEWETGEDSEETKEIGGGAEQGKERVGDYKRQ